MACAGVFYPRLAYAMLLWDAVVLFAALMDGLRLPRPSTITATRSWLSAPSLGAKVEIELSIFHKNNFILDLQLIDDLPTQLISTPARHKLRVLAWTSVNAPLHGNVQIARGRRSGPTLL